MKKPKDEVRPPVVAAAEILASQLARLGELRHSLEKEAFATQKSVDRGASTLREVGECETVMAKALAELVQALGGVRDEQAQHHEVIAARAKELETRAMLLKELLARYEGLGIIAAQVNTVLQELPAKGVAGNGSGAAHEAAGALPQLIESVGKAADAAKTLATDAETHGFPDVARNTENLRQQILGAQNKMNLLLQKLKPQA